MLRPTKHSHPDRTVINVSLLLLARLKTRRIDDYDALRKFAKKALSVERCCSYLLLIFFISWD
jgi:hypothetical protein